MLLEVGTGATIRFRKSPQFREWYVQNHITYQDMIARSTDPKSTMQQFESTASDAPRFSKAELANQATRRRTVDESRTHMEWQRHISIGVGRCVSPITLCPGQDWSAEWTVNVEDLLYDGSPEIGSGSALEAQSTPVSGIPDSVFFKLKPEQP